MRAPRLEPLGLVPPAPKLEGQAEADKSQLQYATDDDDDDDKNDDNDDDDDDGEDGDDHDDDDAQ